MKISVFGLGYVGAVGCGCLAELGHRVIGIDAASAKVELMASGKPPIAEPGLRGLLEEAVRAGRLTATTDPAAAIHDSDVAMICVGTPSTSSGGVNTTALEMVCRQIGDVLRDSEKPFFTVVVRSTSLPPVHRALQRLLEETSGRTVGKNLGYVCHPEFLREGSAVDDFHHPSQTIFGVSDERSREVCQALYPGLATPAVFVTPEAAAMIKYAGNTFHAAKIAFANEIGQMCRQFGLDAQMVMDVFCQDQKLNISPRYLRPGAAFGGSCLPKDLRALLDGARQNAVTLPMLSSILKSNNNQVRQLLDRVLSPERPAVGIVGLAFKEGTDDVRESPMVTVVEHLCGKGHPVRIYDPQLSVESMIGANRRFALHSIPHLTDLLTDDLQRMVSQSKTLLVSFKLSPQVWKGLTWPKDLRVIDMVNLPELRAAPRYEGLYW